MTNSTIDFNANNNATITATLRRTADERPRAGEFRLVAGRANKASNQAPTHIDCTRFDAAAITPAFAECFDTSTARAASKLWKSAIELKLSEDAKGILTGQSIAVTITAAGIVSAINDRGEVRAVFSKEMAESFTASYLFPALAEVWNWNEKQSQGVSLALTKLAAPAFSLPPAQAELLASRLAAASELLTGEDTTLDAELTHVLGMMKAKLDRMSQQAADTLDI